MDPVTLAVRQLYTEHPYPAVPAHLRHDSFPYQLLSEVEGGPLPSSLQILDAGCGTGAGVIPVATQHPDARVVGIDLSETALSSVRAEVLRRGLTNLELRALDLMDANALAGLRDRSPNGFDVIYASGVIHHLSDAELGLSNLAALLAPGGVMSLMVYGEHGRRPVTRMAEALQRICAGLEGDARLTLARDLVRELPAGPVTRAPWDDAELIHDAEFVDRYLHVNAETYTVPQALDLIASSGLRLLRWTESRAWSPLSLFGPGRVTDALDALPPRARWAAIELLFDRPGLEMLLVRPGTEERAAVTSLDGEVVAWNPQATFVTRERRYLGSGRIERVHAQLRSGPSIELLGVHATLATLLDTAIPAASLIEQASARADVSAQLTHDALLDLVRGELVYRPRPIRA